MATPLDMRGGTSSESDEEVVLKEPLHGSSLTAVRRTSPAAGAARPNLTPRSSNAQGVLASVRH